MKSTAQYARRQEGDYGFFRVASAIPSVRVGDVDYNVEHIELAIDQAREQHASLLALPELAITGYTCADLMHNDLLLDSTEQAILRLRDRLQGGSLTIVVGAPLRMGSMLLNCAVVISGTGMWVVPKTYLPNYKEFYEKRWFTSGIVACATSSAISIVDETVPMSTRFIFDLGGARMAVELCEDLWVPIPPSSLAALHGANVLVNPSASNEVVGKHEYLLDLIRNQSARCIAAYVYSSAGWGESTTDLVFAGNAVVAENGIVLKEAKRFEIEPQFVVSDIDVEALENERRTHNSFADCLVVNNTPFTMIDAAGNWQPLNYDKTALKREIERLPFVPQENKLLSSRCDEIVHIQTSGLMRRLQHTGIKSVVIGISGGLDSTLALMIACRAFDRLRLDRKGIFGITMPGFGTTSRTLTNALELMKALGITVKEIGIADAVAQHLHDIDHSLDSHDTTYENAQARERTQILMDYANKTGSLVLGTGDLSELALGWCTYNGDHMSMYNVNGSIPKTLAKHLVMWFADDIGTTSPTALIIRETLLDVLHTPISPELTPADSKGNIKQKTEDIIGPYELHDFFLYHTIRHGSEPRKIFYLARQAFGNDYDPATIKRWLTTFVRRFFAQQFKRSCLPDGPKVGNVSLSPRGDWRMPSDAAVSIWLKQCEALPE